MSIIEYGSHKIIGKIPIKWIQLVSSVENWWDYQKSLYDDQEDVLCACLLFAATEIVEFPVVVCGCDDTSDFTRLAMCDLVCLRKWSLR